MFELIASLIVGLFLFVCTITAYCKGIEHGRELSKGNTPKIELNPIKPIVKAVETRKEQKEADKLTDELTNVLGYNMQSALDFVKKER